VTLIIVGRGRNMAGMTTLAKIEVNP